MQRWAAEKPSSRWGKGTRGEGVYPGITALMLGEGKEAQGRVMGQPAELAPPRTAPAVSWASGSPSLSLSLAVGQAVALAVALEDVAAMGEVVEGGAGEARKFRISNEDGDLGSHNQLLTPEAKVRRPVSSCRKCGRAMGAWCCRLPFLVAGPAWHTSFF